MIFSEFCSLVLNLNMRLWITTWEVPILVKEILEDLFSSSSVSIRNFQSGIGILENSKKPKMP